MKAWKYYIIMSTRTTCNCTCTWESSDTNDVASFDGAMDLLKVLFCFSTERERERERERKGVILKFSIHVYIPCICHDLKFNPFPSQVVEDEFPSTLPLSVDPSRHTHSVRVMLPCLQILVCIDKVCEGDGDIKLVGVRRRTSLLLSQNSLAT